MEKYLFDLEIGERFRCLRVDKTEPTVYEVISPWGMSGIPYAFGFLGGTRKQVDDNKVYAFDTKASTFIRVFDQNAKVFAY